MAPRSKAAPAGTEQDKDKALSTVKDEKTGKTLTIQQLKNKLRNEAEREVLDKHKREVVDITAKKYEAHGLEYVRRLSEEEKAARQVEEIYEKYPHLRPKAAPDHPFEEGYVPVTRETFEAGE